MTGTVWLGTGQYEVTFSSNVSGCAYVATPMNAYSQALQVFTAGGQLSPNGVYVRSLLFFGGALANEAFHAATVCP